MRLHLLVRQHFECVDDPWGGFQQTCLPWLINRQPWKDSGTGITNIVQCISPKAQETR